MNDRKTQLDEVVLSGAELRRRFGTEDAKKLDKDLDDLKTRFGDLATKCADGLRKMEEAAPIAKHFYATHEQLLPWLQKIEPELHGKELPGQESEAQLKV